MTNAITTDHNI